MSSSSSVVTTCRLASECPERYPSFHHPASWATTTSRKRQGRESEEQLAVFDLLQKASLTKSERETIKQAARELLERLMGGKLRIDRWREKATAQVQVRTEIIDHLFTHLPEVYDGARVYH